MSAAHLARKKQIVRTVRIIVRSSVLMGVRDYSLCSLKGRGPRFPKEQVRPMKFHDQPKEGAFKVVVTQESKPKLDSKIYATKKTEHTHKTCTQAFEVKLTAC